jgi:hypothetical protein
MVAVKKLELETLEVFMIGLSPVVRECLQPILTKGQGIKVIGDHDRLYLLLNITIPTNE